MLKHYVSLDYICSIIHRYSFQCHTDGKCKKTHHLHTANIYLYHCTIVLILHINSITAFLADR